jgi:diacylglycerol kinase (ATP)
VARLLADNGVATELYESRSKGGVEQLVAEAIRAGHHRVLVAGGDGSIHEAVNGIMRTAGDTALGIIPVGTGNDFAKACSVPLHFEHATALLADRMNGNAPPLAIDVGRCNDRYFINGAGIGFDARVSAIAERLRWPIGDFVYLVALLKALRDGVSTPELSVRFGDNELTGAVTLVNFANGPWVGGMFHIAPEAENGDGLLDLIYAEPVGILRILGLLPNIMRGHHMNEVEVHHFRLRSATIESAEPVLAQLDGEILAPATRFAIELLPGALRLL